MMQFHTARQLPDCNSQLMLLYALVINYKKIIKAITFSIDTLNINLYQRTHAPWSGSSGAEDIGKGSFA